MSGWMAGLWAAEDAAYAALTLEIDAARAADKPSEHVAGLVAARAYMMDAIRRARARRRAEASEDVSYRIPGDGE